MDRGNNPNQRSSRQHQVQRFSSRKHTWGSWDFNNHNYPKRNGSNKRNGLDTTRVSSNNNHHCYFVSPVNVRTVDGVSATAGSCSKLIRISDQSEIHPGVTRVHISLILTVVESSVKGPTLNITPFITGSASAQKPFEGFYDTPVYDMRDLDEDGAPDNQLILWYQPTRTGQKDNYNLSLGVSATWSIPQDKKLQDQ